MPSSLGHRLLAELGQRLLGLVSLGFQPAGGRRVVRGHDVHGAPTVVGDHGLVPLFVELAFHLGDGSGQLVELFEARHGDAMSVDRLVQSIGDVVGHRPFHFGLAQVLELREHAVEHRLLVIGQQLELDLRDGGEAFAHHRRQTAVRVSDDRALDLIVERLHVSLAAALLELADQLVRSV